MRSTSTKPDAVASRRVAALVPAYQAASFIQDTLNSLSAQTYQPLTVIISVDRGDDNTYEVCVDHAARDRRFTVVRQEQRLGYVGNCNFLLRQTDADYLCFAFHDDILLPTYLDELVGALESRPNTVIAYSDLLLSKLDGTREECSFMELDGLQDRVERGRLMLRPVGKWWVPNRGLFRHGMVRRIGGLKTHGFGGFAPDWPWLFHMSLLGEFHRVPSVLCHKYFKETSLSRSWNGSPAQWNAAKVACLQELWASDLRIDEKLRVARPSLWVLKAWLRDRLFGS